MFRNLMDSLFRYYPFIFVYLDDILIFSKTHAEHLICLNQVFDVLAINGLCINLFKNTFAAPEVDCLDHCVTYAGLHPLSSKVQPILSFSPPSDLSSLHRLLGMLNFYSRGYIGALKCEMCLGSENWVNIASDKTMTPICS